MCNKVCNCLIAAIISAILGIIVGFISFGTAIPGIVTVTWVALGLAIGALVLTFTAGLNSYGKEERCICKYGKCIAIGAIGTIIAAIIALAITITTGVVLISILLGLGVFFLALTIFSVLEFILCIVESNCKFRG